MKKRGLSLLLILCLLVSTFLIIPVIKGQEDNISSSNTTSNLQNNDAKIDKAYNCLEKKVEGKCATLSPEGKILTLLAIGKCKDEVVADSVSEEYWTKQGSDIKATAQAILALDKTSTFNTQPAEEWLLTQQGSPEDVDWYLQIDADKESACSIKYDGLTHNVKIDENKKLNTGAGNCLTLSQEDYWLKIIPGCYDREYEISCDEDFLTALLFKEQTSSTINILDISHSASANGRTTEKVNSACLLQNGECNYEGTLWAAMVLDYKGYDTSAYMPYLTTMASENSEYIPESFLYLLTGSVDYRTDLLSKQKNNKYWDQYKDKFYDTALALYSISDQPLEKINSKDWLFEVQGEDGCWEGNVRNTAFLLASIWPKQFNIGKSNCEASGYYCMAEVNCEGDVLSDYSCPGVLSCCSESKSILTCEEQTGKICVSDESCSGGELVEATNLGAGEKCCIGGVCKIEEEQSECESYGGTCRPFGCEEGEKEEAYNCDFGDTCCVSGKEESGGIFWIVFFSILIILAVLGIIFRKKLRELLEKIKNKFGGSKGSGSGPGPNKPGPPGRPGPGVPGGKPRGKRPQRRILPPQQRKIKRPAPGKKPQSKGSSEVKNVLNKLKKMGK